jgi:hypothetical protein
MPLWKAFLLIHLLFSATMGLLALLGFPRSLKK